MLLRPAIANLLADFEKRMKFINIVRFLLDYKYPDAIRAMFPDKLILDNIILAVLVYINDRTLGARKNCTISDIQEFLDELMAVLPDPEHIDTTDLARYIVVDVLQKGGVPAEYQTYFSTSESFELMPIRIINEEKGNYHLTDDAFDFLFRSKEIESELDYSVTRFRMKEYMKRDNYEEALAASRELVERIRSMKDSMDNFLSRCRENISKITVDQYDNIISRVRRLLDEEYAELTDIQNTANERIRTLESAQRSGVSEDEIHRHRTALREIVNNISLTIEEQRSLINKKTSLADSYRALIRDNFVVTRFERMNFERDIMVPLRTKDVPLGDAAKFFLFMLTKPEFEKRWSIDSIFAPQGRIREAEDELGIDISIEDSDAEENIRCRNERHKRIIHEFFSYAQGKKAFTASDFIRSLRVADIENYCIENTLPNVLLTLFSMQELNIETWMQEEHFTIVPNGEFELAWCLEELAPDYLTIKTLQFKKLGTALSLECKINGSIRRIDMTDFVVEVFL